MAKKTKAFTKGLAEKSVTELLEMLENAQKELFFLKMKNKIRAVQKTHEIRQKRKNIARIQTLLTVKTKENDGNTRG